MKPIRESRRDFSLNDPLMVITIIALLIPALRHPAAPTMRSTSNRFGFGSAAILDSD
jgi:hypothetical protein